MGDCTSMWSSNETDYIPMDLMNWPDLPPMAPIGGRWDPYPAPPPEHMPAPEPPAPPPAQACLTPLTDFHEQQQQQHQQQHQQQQQQQHQQQQQQQQQHQQQQQQEYHHHDNQKMIFPVSREQEIREMSDFIKSIIESRGNRPDGLSSRVRVHEVILIVLLVAEGYLRGAIDFPDGLTGILAFCDEQGRRCSGESGFFKALDTETMALLWQRIKGNRTGKYETFARAMRVRRSASGSGGYFASQDSGRSKKKRVYKLGRKSQEEMERLRQTLQEFVAQQQQQRMHQQYYK